MHELGLMQNIVDTVQEYAQKNNLSKVVKVRLEVGKLSGVVPEALEFCFEVCVKQTVLEGAVLEIERVAAMGKCKACEDSFDLVDENFTCPKCGGGDWELISGREFIIKELEGI
jgi:hydrogenase nickel incorporation protein HypA/HybF